MGDSVGFRRDEFVDVVRENLASLRETGIGLLSELDLLCSDSGEDDGQEFMDWLRSNRLGMYNLVDDPSINSNICDVLADIEEGYSDDVLISMLADYAEYKPSWGIAVLTGCEGVFVCTEEGMEDADFEEAGIDGCEGSVSDEG